MLLNPEGTAFEVNRDENGVLWISDYEASEIWLIHPAQGIYTVHMGISRCPVTLAGMEPGTCGGGEGENNHLGRLSTGSRERTLWEMPGARRPFRDRAGPSRLRVGHRHW